jgi:hypothetical protein
MQTTELLHKPSESWVRSSSTGDVFCALHADVVTLGVLQLLFSPSCPWLLPNPCQTPAGKISSVATGMIPVI